MPRYPNGFIPRSELVYIEGNHLATRGTAARWEALKSDVLEKEGVRLRITGGENAYRSFAGQQFARRNACARGRCNDAAVPGFSSHGGSLNGRDSGAIDVDNWAELGKEKFYAYCRKHGFEPGYFSWEPWHIIDWMPYTVPSPKPTPSGGGATPAPKPNPEPIPEEEEEEEMTATYINVQGKAGSHSAGTFAIMRSNGGILFAKRVNTSILPGVPTITNDRLADWQKTMKFYEL